MEKTQAKHLTHWLFHGNSNPWICQVGSGNPEDTCAFEAPWGEAYFHHSENLTELIKKFQHGNWMLGTAFWLEYKAHEFCSINQVNGGDEWLVIRDNIAFESWSCEYLIRKYGEREFIETLDRMASATIDALVTLTY